MSKAERVVFYSILISIFFDISFSIASDSYPSKQVAHFYPLVSTITWFLAYLTLFNKLKTEKRASIISFALASSAIIFLMMESDLGNQSTIGSIRAVNYLFLITLAIIYFFHSILKREQYDFLQSSFFWFSAMNLIHFSTAIVIFTFFEMIKSQDSMLYFSMFFKWFLMASSNLLFAYVFYNVAKGNMISA